MDTLKHVLVVDDEADIADLVLYNLKKEGFAVDSASDGGTCARQNQEREIRPVILDLMLPGVQGMESLPHHKKRSKDCKAADHHAYCQGRGSRQDNRS